MKDHATNPEQPISVDKIQENIKTPTLAGRSQKSDADFFKKLFSWNGSMITCRFLIYAVDKPERPSNFSLKELAEWTVGTEAANLLEIQGDLNILLYPASLLIQTGALEGAFNITRNGASFESIRVNPGAHQALEELFQEGSQMIAHVDIV